MRRSHKEYQIDDEERKALHLLIDVAKLQQMPGTYISGELKEIDLKCYKEFKDFYKFDKVRIYNTITTYFQIPVTRKEIVDFKNPFKQKKIAWEKKSSRVAIVSVYNKKEDFYWEGESSVKDILEAKKTHPNLEIKLLGWKTPNPMKKRIPMIRNIKYAKESIKKQRPSDKNHFINLDTKEALDYVKYYQLVTRM